MKNRIPSTTTATLFFSALLLATPLYFTACTTPGVTPLTKAQELAIANKIVDTDLTVTGYGAFVPVSDQLSGMAAQLWAGQPAAQGTTVPALAAAVVKQFPAGTTSTQQAAILDAAAQLATAKAASGAQLHIDVSRGPLAGVTL